MITKLVVQGFRGITQEQVFEPEVLTVLTGRNGFGKTTFFDAIDWCLFGDASRFGSDPTVLANLYTSADGPRIELHLDCRGKAMSVVRTASEVRLDGAVVEERALAEALIVDPEVFPPYLRDLGQQVRSVTYLAQEQIRNFVSASVTSERRALLHGLLGVPNAGLVESSIKRVRDQFSARERRLLETIDQLSRELADTAVLELDLEAAADANRFIEALGGKFPGTDLTAVRAQIEAALLASEGRAAALETTLIASADLASTVSHADAELAAIEQQRSALEEQLRAASAAVEDGKVRIAVALNDQKAALAQLAQAERQATSLTAQLAEQERAAALEAQVLAAANVVAIARDALDLAIQEAETAALQLRDAERAAGDRQRQALLFEERSKRANERASLQARLTALESDFQESVVQTETLEATAVDAELALRTAIAARDDLAARQRAAASAAERRGQIAALREQLVTLMTGDETRCPLCGTDYVSHEELRTHIEGATTQTEQSQLHSLTSSLNDAHTAVHRAQAGVDHVRTMLTSTRRRLEELRRKVADVTEKITSVDVALTAFADVSEVFGVEDAIQLRDRARVLSTKANEMLAQRQEQLREAEARRQVLATEQKLVASRLQENRTSPQVLEQVTSAVATAQQHSLETASNLQELRAAYAVSESALADTRSQSDGLGSRAQAESVRKERAIQELSRSCESLGVVFTSLSQVRDELSSRLAAERHGITGARDALARATAIERRLIANRSVANEQSQRKQLSGSKEALDTLRRAQERFGAIAQSLEARARHEADAAGAQHRAAIQECINALYPHRHLNEVDLDFANGELLVKDRWLVDGVRPEEYSSTGQANVLALSVFLGLALRQTFALNRFLLLDEPVQNLDDLHFLAFITLIKRIALSRQVIVSTADSNIADVLRRQLRSWSGGSRRWCEYEWVGFDPVNGPMVKRREGQKIAVA